MISNSRIPQIARLSEVHARRSSCALRRQRMAVKRTIGFAVALMLGLAAPTRAATVFVNDISGTGARNFTDATIWSTAAVPAAGDFPVIDFGNGVTDYVYVDSPVDVQRVNVGNLVSGGLEVRAGGTLTTNLGGGSQSNIGPTGTGHLRILSGATVNHTGLLYLGLNTAGNGTVTLEDGGTHTVGGALAIRDGTGVYNMLGGSLTIGDFFQISRAGNGSFLQSGGTLAANRNASAQGMLIAGVAGANGLYEISDGSLTVAGTNTGVINGLVSADPEAGGAFGVFRIVGSQPTVTIETNYDQRNDSRYEVVIDAGGVSAMNVGGDVSLRGGLGVSFTSTPTIGDHFTIINYGGALSGAFGDFDTLVDSPLGPDSVQLSIDYGTGSDSAVVLTVVPEPANIVLLMSAGVCVMIGGCARRRGCRAV